jgi:hypothetical protein
MERLKKYLVVYEDLNWNKDYVQTHDIKTTIIDMMNEFDLVLLPQDDIESIKTNDDFISKGAFGDIIYDIEIYEKNNPNEHAGRFMIFYLWESGDE